jgi:hypothetical protein
MGLIRHLRGGFILRGSSPDSHGADEGHWSGKYRAPEGYVISPALVGIPSSTRLGKIIGRKASSSTWLVAEGEDHR